MSRNKYPGYCYCCGEYVKPGFGHYEKTRGKKHVLTIWKVAY